MRRASIHFGDIVVWKDTYGLGLIFIGVVANHNDEHISVRWFDGDQTYDHSRNLLRLYCPQDEVNKGLQ